MEDVTKNNLDNLSSSHFIHKKMNLPFFEWLCHNKWLIFDEK